VTVAACDACLRRTDLVAAVAGSIDVAWRERRGRTARVLALRDEDLLALDPSAAPRYATFDADRARARVAGAGLVAVCRCEPEYPDRLRELPDPPAVLHVAGSLGALPSGAAVAIVGARRATPYGLEVSRSLGRALTAAGLPVVSGMALGIDSAAHVGALEGSPSAAIARARPDGPPAPPAAPPVATPPAAPPPVPPPAAPPVAVLAGGAETAYPARMRGLHARLVEAGAVVSEMPPGFTGHRWCFPARNRIIAALTSATVVVEAAIRSGSLITADLAADLGRIVAAVPGPVTSRASAGANELLHAGAAVIRGPRDVLDLVLGADAPALAEPDPPLPPLDPAQRRLLDAIERGRGTLAELATTMEEARAASRSLSQLELLGLVRRGFGGRYVRCP
jgi:DNA processing protein